MYYVQVNYIGVIYYSLFLDVKETASFSCQFNRFT